MAAPKQRKLALVLTGGGARSAYHAGVLSALNKLLAAHGHRLKFNIYSGISGGAINATFLAARAENLPKAIRALKNNWSRIAVEDILDVNGFDVVRKASHLVLQLGGGGLFNKFATTQLMDTAPLLEYLRKNINFKKLEGHIDSGLLRGVAVSATNYGTGSAVTFYDGSASIVPWSRSHYTSQRARLSVDHVLASASIPIAFPPVKVMTSYYGDGAIRMKYPMSPAIHMGADKILAIGLRKPRTPAETLKLNQAFEMKKVQLSDILGVVSHSLFLDGLDDDLERMHRVNRYMEIMRVHPQLENPENLKVIPVLALRPSEDLGIMASEALKKMPRIFRHFLKGLGVSEYHGGDTLSYLAFDKSYSEKLIALGQKDVWDQQDQVLEWFETPGPNLKASTPPELDH